MAKEISEASRVAKFWSDYTTVLESEGVTKSNAEWARKHVESYIKKTGNVKLQDQVAEDLTHYLAVWVHKNNPSSFVLDQKITALRLLFEKIVKTDWAGTYPWAKWKEPHLNFGDRIEQYSGEREDWRPVIKRSFEPTQSQAPLRIFRINSSAMVLNLSTASLMPKPNSALSSNSEFDHVGPRPSARIQYGVVGRFPP